MTTTFAAKSSMAISRTINSRDYRGERGNYQQAMYLNAHAPITGGRLLGGFPKVLGGPDLKVYGETLVGRLDYNGIRLATGIMGSRK